MFNACVGLQEADCAETVDRRRHPQHTNVKSLALSLNYEIGFVLMQNRAHNSMNIYIRRLGRDEVPVV